jgi:hypothetical protein
VTVVEAVLLAVVTIVTAWAGYSAAQWSTNSRLDLARASALRIEASRALATAEEDRNFDSSTFDSWFVAYTLGDREAMRIAERRFRPDFVVAFDAWRATDPAHNPHAPPGPTFMPQYHQPDKVQASRLDDQADAAAADGDDAGNVADNYLRLSLVLASVLFLVGIGTTFKLAKVRWGLAAVGGVLLLAALVLMLSQPVP